MEQLSKKAVLSNVEIIIKFLLDKLGKDIKLTKKMSNEIRMICEEVLMNIISYAYTDNVGDMTVKYNFDKVKGIITFEFMDYGVRFNPLENEDPALNLNIMEREIGGLGIFIVKQISDSLSYERIGNMNKLTVKKNIKE